MNERDHFLLPSPRTHTYRKHTHPYALMQRVSGPDRKQRELVRDGAEAQNGITGEGEEGGGQGAKGGQGAPLCFSTDV